MAAAGARPQPPVRSGDVDASRSAPNIRATASLFNVAAVPPGVQELPAEHVQRHGLHRPEHQRLLDQPRTAPTSDQSAQRTGACAPATYELGRHARRASSSRSTFSPDARPARRPPAHLRRHQISQRSGRQRNRRRRSIRRCSCCPGRRSVERAEAYGHRLDRLDAADRRTGMHRPRSMSMAADRRSYNTGSDLFPQKLQDAMPSSTRASASAAPDERWAIELWAQNLFNKNYEQVAFNIAVPGQRATRHGAQVMRFGSPIPAGATSSSLRSSPSRGPTA